MSSSVKVAAIIAYHSTDPKTGTDLKFDMDYYVAKHMPLIKRIWGPYGMRSWSIKTFAPTCPIQGHKPAYLVQTTCMFDSVEGFKEALQHSEESTKDLSNFSNVFPAIWVGEEGASGVL